MNYKFLTIKQLEKTFEETDFSVGEIMLNILKIKQQNKKRLLEMTDEDWYNIIETSFRELSEEEY